MVSLDHETIVESPRCRFWTGLDDTLSIDGDRRLAGLAASRIQELKNCTHSVFESIGFEPRVVIDFLPNARDWIRIF